MLLNGKEYVPDRNMMVKTLNRFKLQNVLDVDGYDALRYTASTPFAYKRQLPIARLDH